MLYLHSIETFGTHEGPGIRLVFFLSGCNFRCLYCHNPDTFCLDKKNKKNIAELIDIAKKQKPYFNKIGGVTISGGEPTLQAKELIKLFTALKKEKIHTAIDTNGGIINSDVKKLYSLADLIILDVKHIDNKKHLVLTGANNTNTLTLAAYREKIGKPIWLRYVLVPGYNDSENDLRLWAEHFKNFKHIERVEILPYHTLGVYKYKELGIDYKLKNIKPPTEIEIKKAQKIFSQYLKNVLIR